MGSCRLIALLCWYEEAPQWLAATVASLRGVCDHVIAADGTYPGFPDARVYPRSGREQAEVITETAYACNLGLTLISPRDVWEGGEVEKRNAMFDYAKIVGDPGDWVLIVDADEVVTAAPPDLRAQLTAPPHGSPRDSAGVTQDHDRAKRAAPWQSPG